MLSLLIICQVTNALGATCVLTVAGYATEATTCGTDFATDHSELHITS